MEYSMMGDVEKFFNSVVFLTRKMFLAIKRQHIQQMCSQTSCVIAKINNKVKAFYEKLEMKTDNN